MVRPPMEHTNRLFERFRPTRSLSPYEAFQFRFLVGSALLGLVVAALSAAVSVFTGPWLSTVIITAFGVGLVGLLLGTRLGAPLPVLGWSCLTLLGLFLLFDSLITAELHESQLRWMVLLPMVAMVLSRESPLSAKATPPTRAVAMATLLAILFGMAIVAAHAFGWTAGFSEPTSSRAWTYLGSTLDYVMFVVSVAGLLWVYELALRMTEEELLLLRRALSVCAWCRRIRVAKSGWISLEQHLESYHETGLTHGICPECARAEFHEAALRNAPPPPQPPD